MMTLGLGNLVGAEDWAKDQWTGAQGREQYCNKRRVGVGHQNCRCRADDLDSQFHLERGSEGTIWRHCDCALCGRRDLHCEFSIGEGLRRRRIDSSAVDHRSTVDHLWALVSCATGWNGNRRKPTEATHRLRSVLRTAEIRLRLRMGLASAVD